MACNAIIKIIKVAARFEQDMTDLTVVNETNASLYRLRIMHNQTLMVSNLTAGFFFGKKKYKGFSIIGDAIRKLPTHQWVIEVPFGGTGLRVFRSFLNVRVRLRQLVVLSSFYFRTKIYPGAVSSCWKERCTRHSLNSRWNSSTMMVNGF